MATTAAHFKDRPLDHWNFRGSKASAAGLDHFPSPHVRAVVLVAVTLDQFGHWGRSGGISRKITQQIVAQLLDYIN